MEKRGGRGDYRSLGYEGAASMGDVNVKKFAFGFVSPGLVVRVIFHVFVSHFVFAVIIGLHFCSLLSSTSSHITLFINHRILSLSMCCVPYTATVHDLPYPSLSFPCLSVRLSIPTLSGSLYTNCHILN